MLAVAEHFQNTSIGAGESSVVDWFEQEAFKHLVEQYRLQIYRQALRMLGCVEDAEEATQDVFIRAYKGLRTYRGDGKLATWLYRITYNTCISRLRKKQLLTVPLDASIEDHRPQRPMPDPHPDPEALYFSRRLSERLRDLITSLPPKYRDILELYHFQERSYEEIANLLNVPVGTVKTHLFRARGRLRRLVAKQRTRSWLNPATHPLYNGSN